VAAEHCKYNSDTQISTHVLFLLLLTRPQRGIPSQFRYGCTYRNTLMPVHCHTNTQTSSVYPHLTPSGNIGGGSCGGATHTGALQPPQVSKNGFRHSLQKCMCGHQRGVRGPILSHAPCPYRLIAATRSKYGVSLSKHVME